jgi:hypothetical protein
MNIAQLRLQNQHIARAMRSQPADVVEWLGAVQAQDYAGAKWALGLRLQGAVDGDIDQALADGSILRTHVMRPTWHFVTPSDIRWLLALTAPRVHAVNAIMYRKLELDSGVLMDGSAVLTRALRDGSQLTRDELRLALQKAGIAAEDGLRLAYIVMYAELEGLICSGARRGKQFTYALLDNRAPNAKNLGREDALAELAGRFFISRGPATVQDFAHWSGLTLADARQGLDAISSRLHSEVIGDFTYWLPPSTPQPGDEGPAAHILSIYDEYVSGYKDRRDIGTAVVGDRLLALGNDLSYIVVVNGLIVGTWKRTLKKDAVIIKTNLFTELSPSEKQAVAAAAKRYGEFLQLPVVLSPE